jgi:hypothetical protein
VTSPQAQLYERLSDALGGHDPDPDVANRIRRAYVAAGMDSATWDDLPAEIQRLVEEVEKLPPTSFDSPDDVPEDTSYMDDGVAATESTDEELGIQTPDRRGPYVRVDSLHSATDES